MRKRIESLALLGAMVFAWTKLGIGTAVKEMGIIPNGTSVQYIPVGKTKWSDAQTGTVTNTFMGEGDFAHLRYYMINGNIQILATYVRRV